jgi:transposase
VRETLRRFEGAGLGWALPDGMSDGDLEAALYANHGTKRGHRRHAEPDWPTVHRELKRKHVTLVIVWDEYIAANPGGWLGSDQRNGYAQTGGRFSGIHV